MADDIPQWALERAVDKAAAECGPHESIYDRELVRAQPHTRAFARYIAEHEEPPVDPLTVKTAAAFEALWNEDEYGTVERWAGRLRELLEAQGLQIVERQS